MAGRGITLEQAQTVVSAALKEARALGLKPVSVAVLDPGGHMVAFAREDNSSNLRPQIATAKASGALGLGVSSSVIGEMAIERPAFINAAAGLNPAGVVPAAGGVLVRNGDGEVIGAVGVTGDTSDNDEKAALAGIAAAGLSVWRDSIVRWDVGVRAAGLSAGGRAIRPAAGFHDKPLTSGFPTGGAASV